MIRNTLKTITRNGLIYRKNNHHIYNHNNNNNNSCRNIKFLLNTLSSSSSSSPYSSSPSPFSVVEHKIHVENSQPEAPHSFAVIKMSGTQYKVTIDDVITTHKIKDVKVGEQMEINDVLLIGTKDQTIVGRPLIPNAKVIATVEEQTRDKKLIVFKKKKRKGYKKKQGHRSYITVLRINDIVNDNK